MNDTFLEVMSEAAERALERAGVKHWEIYLEVEDAAMVEVQDGQLLAATRTVERSMALRVLDGGIGFWSATEPLPEDLPDSILEAMMRAKQSRPAAIAGFAAQAPAVSLALDDPSVKATVHPELIEAAHQLARIGGKVRPAAVAESRSRLRLRTSAGLDVGWSSSAASASVVALAEMRGHRQLGTARAAARSLPQLPLLSLGAKALAHAHAKLRPARVATGRRTVLFAPEIVAELITLLIEALSAEQVERGTSLLLQHGGAPILGKLTLYDDPHDTRLDAVPYDGEGLPTARRTFVEAGEVLAWIHDRDSAARAGVEPTGQTLRSGIDRPAMGLHAPVVAPGPAGVAQLAREAQLLVADVSGAHHQGEANGRLSLGAEGWKLRSGVPAEAFEGVTLAGDLVNFLSVGVWSRERVLVDGRWLPWLWVPDVQISG